MFERLYTVIRGMLLRLVSRVEHNSPEALLETEKENLRTQLGRFNEGLVSHAALCERLIEQVKKLEKEEEDASVRITAHLRAGNRRAAAELALGHQMLAREVEENRLQAKEAETTYRDLVRARDAAVDAARTKIEQLRRGIDEMRIQEAMADLNQMAAGLITSVGGGAETLSRLEQMIEDSRSRAAGVTRVTRDQLDIGKVELREQEQEALAEQALADFAAREGIALDATGQEDTGAPVSAKQMGPATTESGSS